MPKIKRTMHDILQENRPIEKLVAIGEKALSDIELLAIILGSGDRDKNAVELAYEILSNCNDDFTVMANKTIPELTASKGVGIVKAARIKASLEFARRYNKKAKSVSVITHPDDVFELLENDFVGLRKEKFVVVLLNTKNYVISVEEISVGILNSSLVHAREIFNPAIRKNAASVILVHNHPSGVTKPSKDDIETTKKMISSSEIIGIPIYDHIIIADGEYFSFKSNDILF